MKCYQCSASIPAEVAFCPRCGAPQGFDADLISRARANDQAALAELYNKTYSNVYYTIKSMVKDEDTALDILQDSYLKAFRSLDQLQDPAKFRAWIKRIAHNQTVDVLRQTKAVTFSDWESDDADTPLDLEDTRPDRLPDVVIDQQETARLMRGILDALPADQRAVVSLFYYEQLSVKEIAEELDVSENTVKSRLNYGRKKIETQVKALEKQGTKLYGLAPLPFLLLLFRSQEFYAAEIPAAAILHSISGGITAGSAAAASAGAAGKTAVSAAGKTAVRATAKTAGHALRIKLLAGAAAVAIVGGSAAVLYHPHDDPPPTTQEQEQKKEKETQVLPDDFLMDMEALAEEKLASVLSDNEYLELFYGEGTVDITTDYLRIDHAKLTKKAVFYETGGVMGLYIVFKGDVHISPDWSGFWIDGIAADYKNASIVFKLDSFPLKFMRADGSIVYKKDDFQIVGIYPTRAAFINAVKDDLRYVDHDYYDITLP